MEPTRRDVLKIAAAGAAAVILPGFAFAETFPEASSVPPPPAELLKALRTDVLRSLSLYGCARRTGWFDNSRIRHGGTMRISSRPLDLFREEAWFRSNGLALGITPHAMNEASQSHLPYNILDVNFHYPSDASWSSPDMQPILSFAESLANSLRPFCSDVGLPDNLPLLTTHVYAPWNGEYNTSPLRTTIEFVVICVDHGQWWRDRRVIDPVFGGTAAEWSEQREVHYTKHLMDVSKRTGVSLDLILKCFTLGVKGIGRIPSDLLGLPTKAAELLVAAGDQREKLLEEERTIVENGGYKPAEFVPLAKHDPFRGYESFNVRLPETKTVQPEVPRGLVIEWIQQGRLKKWDLVQPCGTCRWMPLISSATFAVYLPKEPRKTVILSCSGGRYWYPLIG